MDDATRCRASANKGNTLKGQDSQTLPCQLPEGHEGAHRWYEEGNREVTWYGPAEPTTDWCAARQAPNVIRAGSVPSAAYDSGYERTFGKRTREQLEAERKAYAESASAVVQAMLQSEAARKANILFLTKGKPMPEGTPTGYDVKHEPGPIWVQPVKGGR